MVNRIFNTGRGGLYDIIDESSSFLDSFYQNSIIFEPAEITEIQTDNLPIGLQPENSISDDGKREASYDPAWGQRYVYTSLKDSSHITQILDKENESLEINGDRGSIYIYKSHDDEDYTVSHNSDKPTVFGKKIKINDKWSKKDLVILCNGLGAKGAYEIMTGQYL